MKDFIQTVLQLMNSSSYTNMAHVDRTFCISLENTSRVAEQQEVIIIK